MAFTQLRTQPRRAAPHVLRRDGPAPQTQLPRLGFHPGAAAQLKPVEESDGFFEILGGAEGDFLARLDLDRLAGRRIASHAGRALAHLQDAEAGHADALALLEVFDEEPDQVVEDRLGPLFRDLAGG